MAKFHAKIKVELLLLLAICILNFWTWELIKQSPLLMLVLSILTITLFILTYVKVTHFHTAILLVLLVLFCTTSFILLKKNFDISVREKDPTETSIFFKRHGYLSDGLGFLYTNTISLRFYTYWYYPFSNYLRNIAYSIDPNLYFFTSHPREKSGIDEFEKYSPLMLPFFILGLLIHFLSFRAYKMLSAYLIVSVLVTGFINPHFKSGPVLLFPYVNLIILFGVMKILELLKNNYEY